MSKKAKSVSQDKKNALSNELESLAKNPIEENEAGEIEGGFAAPASDESVAPKYDLNISCG